MSKRSKAPASLIHAARDREDAEAMIAAIGDAQRAIGRISDQLKADTAALKQQAEAQAKPLQDQVDLLTQRLKLWAEGNRHALTEAGSRKTVKLATGELAWRQAPPAVRITGEADVLKELLRRRLIRFVRRKLEVDRSAMLADPEAAQRVPGVSIGSKGEEFIVTPAGLDLAQGGS